MADADCIGRYRASGTCTPKGVLIMLGLGGAGLALACLVICLISQVLYVGVLFPLALGLAVGVGVDRGVRIGKCRRPLAAAVIGAALGAGGYLLLHYVNYWSHTRAFRKVISRAHGSDRDRKDVIDEKVRQAQVARWGSPGFGGYVRGWWRGIRRLLWGVEIAIAVGLAAWYPFSGAHTPFCEECGVWCERAKIRTVPLVVQDALLGACCPEGVEKIRDLETTGDYGGRCVVELDFCPECRETGYVTVTAIVEEGAKGESEKVLLSEALVSGPEVSTLIADVESQVTPPASEAVITEEETPVPSAGEEACESIPAAEGVREEGKGTVAAKDSTSESSEKDGLANGKV